MSAALDMSLEDLIKKNKKPGGGNVRGRGGGRGSGPGPARRIPNRASSRAGPYSTGQVNVDRISNYGTCRQVLPAFFGLNISTLQFLGVGHSFRLSFSMSIGTAGSGSRLDMAARHVL